MNISIARLTETPGSRFERGGRGCGRRVRQPLLLGLLLISLGLFWQAWATTYYNPPPDPDPTSGGATCQAPPAGGTTYESASAGRHKFGFFQFTPASSNPPPSWYLQKTVVNEMNWASSTNFIIALTNDSFALFINADTGETTSTNLGGTAVISGNTNGTNFSYTYSAPDYGGQYINIMHAFYNDVLNLYKGATNDILTRTQFRIINPGYTDGDKIFSGYSLATLSDEYTTALLVSKCLGDLGSVPYANIGAGSSLSGVAVSTLDTNEYAVSMTKARTTWQVYAEDGKQYQLTYTTNENINGSSSTSTSIPVIVDGTGDLLTYVVAIAAPSVGGGVYYHSISVALDFAPYEPACNTCASSSAGPPIAGQGSLANNSVDFKLGLGRDGQKGLSAGHLQLYATTPSLALATPAALQLVLAPGHSTNITSGGVLQQIWTDRALATVSVSNSFKYAVSFYAKVGGEFQTNAAPYVTWLVENPYASATNINLLRITEIRGDHSITNDYLWVTNNAGWTLTAGNGLKKDVRTSSWNANQTIRTETRQIYNPANNQLIYQSSAQYQVFTWGQGMISETVGTGASARTTTYAYTLDGQRSQVIHPDGSWQNTVYDASNRVSVVYSSFLNQAPTTNASLCRATTYSYVGLSGSGDDGTLNPGHARTVVETLLGAEVGRHYSVVLTNEVREITCQTAGAAWTASDNLVTITKKYAEGDFVGETQSILNPIGTLTLFEYEIDSVSNRTTVVFSGEPNGGGTAVVAGEKTVTLQGALGQTLSVTKVDIASQIITSSQTYTNFDDFLRPQRVIQLDGSFTDTAYTCCGVETVTDHDGNVTVYSYDDLKRRIVTQHQGISLISVFDAAGNTLAQVRQGTNGSQITLGSAGYDLGGQRTSETNALGYVTTHALSTDGNGQMVRTTTNPEGGTRIDTHYLDGSIKSVTGTATHLSRYEYGVESSLAYTKDIKLDATGADTSEWIKSFTDVAGRSFKTVYPDSAYQQSYFNSVGQLWKQVDPDGVAMLYQYNALGELEYTALDLNRNNTIDFAGTDRITRTVRTVGSATSLSGNARITETYQWTTDSSNTSLLVSRSESLVDGTAAAQTAFGLTSRSYFTCGGACATTNVAPDGAYTVTVKTNGYVASVTRYATNGVQLGQTTFTFDAHGRRISATDARTGTTTNAYNNADQVVSITTPSPGGGQNPQTTSFSFDNMGRAWKVTQPDSGSVTNEYFLTGQLKKTYGARTYPVEYTYDYAGRMKTMKTWQNFASASGAAVTTWNHDAQRGFLVNKRYADNLGPNYSYTAAGRLAARVWARGITTTYTNNNAGELSGITYTGTVTPAVGYTFDRRGRQTTVTQGANTTVKAFNDAGQVLSESHTAGLLNGLSVTNEFDALLRRTALKSFHTSSLILHTSYAYDVASRLQTVSDGTNSATYTYLANSPLVDNVVFKQNATTRMTTTKQYDNVNRLTSIASAPSASSAVNFGYQYNDANQRTRVDLADGSYWLYAYDTLGQVISGKKYWSDNSAVAGQQFEYGFDDIGNRKTTKVGGDGTGANLRQANYSANALNQYTARTVPGFADILGVAHSNATVTVNLQPTSRKGMFFRKELALNNSVAPVYRSVTNVAVLITGGNNIVVTNIGSVFLPQTPEAYSYDADGNLLSDGRWTYTWDAENRPIKCEGLATLPSAARTREEWSYLADGRWSQRIVSQWNGSAFVPQFTNRFVWDGVVLLAVLNGNNAVEQSYLRGLDLSGSLNGAGGVGGLLAVNAGSNGVHFAAMDGNGNVSALIDAASGAESARYEYSPFGETLRATGPMAAVNFLRFSTQFTSDVTRRVKYLYREYVPEVGRWNSRDPIEENGGRNIYGFVSNAAISNSDYLGLLGVSTKNKRIYVGRCELVILYGHGSSKNTWSWRMGPGDCRAGTAVMCWAAGNASGLSSEQSLWGEASDLDPDLIWWGPPGATPPTVPKGLINATDVLNMVFSRAIKKAMGYCKPPCCCSSVAIRFVLDRKGNEVIVDPPNDNKKTDNVPHMPSIIIDCKTKSFRYL